MGRDEELALVAGALRRGGCVVGGAAGVGKSRLAMEAADRWRRGRPGRAVERVLATEAAASVAYGAVAHLLGDGAAMADNPVAAYVRALRTATPDELLLLVDDAQLLDDASAALVLALASTGAATVLATVRDGDPGPDAVLALTKDLGFARLSLQALGRDEVRALIGSLLGATVPLQVHRRTYDLTDGRPLLVRELLLDAVESGSLAQVDGCWQWTGAPPVAQRLQDLVAARTRSLGPEARAGLELLAVAEVLPLDCVEDLGGAVEPLERAGLVTVDHEGGRLVRFAHGVYREVVDADLPATARRRIRIELGRWSSGRRLPAAVLVPVACGLLEEDRGDPGLLLRAGREALRIGDPSLAARLADAAPAGGRLEAGIVGAAARLATGRFAEVEGVLAPLEAEVADAPRDLATHYLRTRAFALHWGSDATEAVLALYDRAETWDPSPAWATRVALLRAWVHVDRAEYDLALRSVGSPRAGLDDETRLLACYARAHVLVAVGRPADAEGLEPELRALIERTTDGAGGRAWAQSYYVVEVARIEAGRDLAGVEGRLRDQLASVQEDGHVGDASRVRSLLGALALARGHAETAVEALRDAIDEPAPADPRTLGGMVWAQLARAHALSGDVPSATATLAIAEEEAASHPTKRRIGHEVASARAWAAVARGHLDEAGRQLRALAGAALPDDVLSATRALHDLARLGLATAEEVEHLGTMAASTQCELLRLGAAHAAAVVARDGTAQLDVAAALAEAGADLLAAEAASGAARRLRDEGRQSSARRAAALAAKHAGLCHGARTPGVVAEAAVPLTPRERQVAGLAAGGASNAEIAERLVLSIRSVETYLLRCYRKLGVASRGELARLLEPPRR